MGELQIELGLPGRSDAQGFGCGQAEAVVHGERRRDEAEPERDGRYHRVLQCHLSVCYDQDRVFVGEAYAIANVYVERSDLICKCA